MSPRRTAAVFRHGLVLMLADPGPIIVTTLMPLVLMAFLQGMGQAVLETEGYIGASGAEHVVPGMAVLFSLFGVIYLGMAFFQEHGWGTWDRLRSSSASPAEILVGKLLPSGLVMLTQTTVLFVAGIGVFGLRVRGSTMALAVMLVVTSVFLLALSMLCVAVFRTINQLSAATNVGAMILGGMGGALAPVSTLPQWVQDVAPVSPAYWALEGFRRVVLDEGATSAIIGPAVVLLTLSAIAATFASIRFRLSDEKVWA